ncbi:MAG: EF-P lysine aminoacylase EpmA [Pirellulaceae bacterium]
MADALKIEFGPSASWTHLAKYAALLRKAREFFERHDFLEVVTPILSRDTVVDRHLDPLRVVMYADPRQVSEGAEWYLQTSPEFHMKRLLAAGAPAIYQFAHAFRAGERGQHHNPEFLMLEWYVPGQSQLAAMQMLSDLANHLLEQGEAERITYRDAFLSLAMVDPFDDPVAKIAAAITSNPSQSPFPLDEAFRDDWLDWLLVERVEPQLGRQRPTILYDYPSSQAALARLRPGAAGSPAVAERFELYWQGVELANGYCELCDSEQLCQRFEENNRLRQQDGKQPLPIESGLLHAMRQGLPECSGVALGFDRVVMLAVGAPSLDDVMAFPYDRA